MNKVQIEDRLIGDGEPCYIIAEACDNHMGNLETAKEMARQAKAFGADAVKYQHHLPEEEMLKEGVPMSKNFNMPLFDFLKKFALKLEDHFVLKDFCGELGITYLCTPFSKKAALEINELVPAFKIGSGELTDIPTLKVIAGLGKPVILSTGMSVIEEIDYTFNQLKPINENIIFMNCTSEYPPKYEDINLGVIQTLKERYGIPIGHSDHTPDIYTCFGAVAKGANLLEKHFILDKKTLGPDQSVSIEPFEFYQLVHGVRKVELAMGEVKQVNDEEKPIRAWAHRSIVSLVDIEPGTVLTEEHLWTKRPGTGIPAKELESILGKKAARPILKDKLLSREDFE
ncbi:MAG TPA: CMP-N-acetylneuraminic acid synthetase [Flavobacteriales bacterium]|jgi:sialic acid synthase SpsE|nr:CMP-N-acetylneuraminic acid synthetase [Flavobacteriales bacterium]